MAWKCPSCNRTFSKSNQYHSCVKITEEEHLAYKAPNVIATYQKLIREVKKFGNVKIFPVKTSIQIVDGSTFISIQTKRDHISVEFQLNKEVNQPPVFRTVQYSKNKIAHIALLESPDDINKKFLALLRASHKLAIHSTEN